MKSDRLASRVVRTQQAVKQGLNSLLLSFAEWLTSGCETVCKQPKSDQTAHVRPIDSNRGCLGALERGRRAVGRHLHKAKLAHSATRMLSVRRADFRPAANRISSRLSASALCKSVRYCTHRNCIQASACSRSATLKAEAAAGEYYAD